MKETQGPKKKYVMKLGERCQVVIPKPVRDALDIKAQDEVIVSVQNGNVIMQPKPRRYSEFMRGLGKEIWKKVDAAEYVRKERESWEKGKQR